MLNTAICGWHAIQSGGGPTIAVGFTIKADYEKLRREAIAKQ